MGTRVIGVGSRAAGRRVRFARLAARFALALVLVGCSENVLGLRGMRTSKSKQAEQSPAQYPTAGPRADVFAAVISGLGLRGPANTASAVGPRFLMVLGGPRFDFLGYLLPPRHPQAVFEPTGAFGHCDASADNLFCRAEGKTYGSFAPSSARSACNVAATDPPVVVDEDGRYYGRFSVSDGIAGHTDSVCAPQGAYASRDGCYLVKWVCSVPETPQGASPSP